MFALPGWVVSPSRLKPVDRRRAIYRLKFSNPKYAELIARYYDGVAVDPALAEPATGGFPVIPAPPS